MKNKLKLGGHLSIRGGYTQAARTAHSMGATAYQYFPKNPRSLGVKAFDANEARRCKDYCQENLLVSIAHTPYPSNLAVDLREQPDAFYQTIQSLKNDLDIAEACGSLGIVVHFGNYKGKDLLQGYKNIIQCINEVLKGWQGSTKLLLENQAGDHGEMGMTLEEMVQIRNLCEQPEHVGFCLDTCHAFAAGVWRGAEDETFLAKGRNIGYWDHLIAVHLNDSKYPMGDRKDRHARVGAGFIKEEGFLKLLQAKELQNKAFILETETGDDGTYIQDMEKISQWYHASAD
ncbi:deoxyribonuclease-4 [Paenibacillus shirakamiensis]|uniref:Deoxyribonuclease-4 n=1 Tax=Paenibacillus shirakamiensis TaxID=1265935 RepID=A0ABS4JDJ7_9BACL|nr:deoxyribonuclease IV [Paenibacillus shirakamiensis]MBP1999792.1 deoxyribonuclease-4 [Paenibacillus shirakamiensis]